jgi:hypothetical protein
VLDDAHAFWLRAPGRGEIRPVALPEPGRGDVVVRTLRSGVSRGTETLVFRGGVPPSQHAAMRAPFQEGDDTGEPGRKCRRLASQQHLAAARLRRHAGGQVDGCAEVVPIALDRWAVMQTHPYRGRTVAEHQLVRDPQTQEDRGSGIRDPEHQGVADGLHLGPTARRLVRAHGRTEVGDDPLQLRRRHVPRSAR